MLKEVKNKTGELLGQYEEVDTIEYKDSTFEVDYVNKDGQVGIKTVSVTKKDILHLATKQVNTDVRNYVAGLAREKKDSKTALLKEYIKSQGIDITLPTEDLKKALGM